MILMKHDAAKRMPCILAGVLISLMTVAASDAATAQAAPTVPLAPGYSGTVPDQQTPSRGAGAPDGTPSPGLSPQPNSPSGGPTDQPLTLADVARIAVGNNTSIDAAQIRLKKAEELIAQVNGQNRPQWRIDAGNAYSSYLNGAPSLPTIWVVNPTLPSGGIIPPVVDAAGNFSSAFLQGGGGYGSGGGATSLSPGILSTPATNSTSPAENGSSAPANGGAATPASGAGTEAGSATPNAASKAAAPKSKDKPSSSGAKPQGASDSHTSEPNPASVLGPLTAPLLEDFLSQGDNAHEGSAGMARAAAANTGSTPQGAGRRGSEQDNAIAKAASTEASSSSSSNDYKRDNYAARLSVIQFIDVFGLIPTERDAERDIRDFYSLDVDRVRNETALAAKNIFFNALFAQENVATLQEQVRYATENVRIAQSRYTHGIVSKYDLLTAQTALAAAQQQLIAAQNQQNLSQAELAYLLGSDPSHPLNIAAPALPPLNTTVDVPTSIQVALSSRPEVLQALKNLHQAQRLTKLAAAPGMPAFGVVASAEEAGTVSTTQPYNAATIEGIVAFPFDDGGVTRSRVRSAKLDVQSAQLSLAQVQFAVGLEVRQAAFNISNAQSQAAAASSAVSRAQEAVRIAQERYSQGLGTVLDELNALAALAAAHTNYSVAQFLYQTSLAQLVRAMGGR